MKKRAALLFFCLVLAPAARATAYQHVTIGADGPAVYAVILDTFDNAIHIYQVFAYKSDGPLAKLKTDSITALVGGRKYILRRSGSGGGYLAEIADTLETEVSDDTPFVFSAGDKLDDNGGKKYHPSSGRMAPVNIKVTPSGPDIAVETRSFIEGKLSGGESKSVKITQAKDKANFFSSVGGDK